MNQLAFPLAPKDLDDEQRLAAAIAARTGRDLSAGLIDRGERAAALRIAIVINKLQGEFGRDFEAIYGEALPPVQRLDEPVESKSRKGATHA